MGIPADEFYPKGMEVREFPLEKKDGKPGLGSIKIEIVTQDYGFLAPRYTGSLLHVEIPVEDPEDKKKEKKKKKRKSEGRLDSPNPSMERIESGKGEVSPRASQGPGMKAVKSGGLKKKASTRQSPSTKI